MTPLSPDRSLSVKRNTVINASTRGMAVLITILLWQAVLVTLAFLLLFLLEVTAASLYKTKALWKAGSPSGLEDVMGTIIVSTLWVCTLHFD